MARKMRVVRVTWVDAYGATTGWTHRDDVPKGPRTITSVGLVLSEDEHGLQLAGSFDHEADCVDNVLHIVPENIRKIERMRRR